MSDLQAGQTNDPKNFSSVAGTTNNIRVAPDKSTASSFGSTGVDGQSLTNPGGCDVREGMPIGVKTAFGK